MRAIAGTAQYDYRDGAFSFSATEGELVLERTMSNGLSGFGMPHRVGSLPPHSVQGFLVEREGSFWFLYRVGRGSALVSLEADVEPPAAVRDALVTAPVAAAHALGRSIALDAAESVSDSDVFTEARDLGSGVLAVLSSDHVVGFSVKSELVAVMLGRWS